MDYPVTRVATIANGTSESNVIKLGRRGVAAIRIPAAWTAAALTVLAAPEGSDVFQAVIDSAGAELSIAVTASKDIVLSPDAADMIAGLALIKFRSGTAALPVNQGAERALTLTLK